VKLIVLDMDRTLIAMHTSGALQKKQLQDFKNTLSPVARALLPRLIEEKFELSVSTLSDDLYTDLLAEKDRRASRPVGEYFSGVPLVNKLLEFLPEEQAKKIVLVTLNPALYRPQNGEGDPLAQFYHKKLDAIGLPKPDAKDAKAEWLREARTYPPEQHKNQHLKILRALKGIEFKEMLLIDDKQENVTEAVKLGAHGVLVPGRHALAWEDLGKIVSPPAPSGA
jgi:FMN phosphatase YigB (HAD superfamily)